MEKTTKFVQHSTWMIGCFIYNSPYQVRDYSKRAKLSILVAIDDKGESDSETPLRVNPLQLLNVIHGETLIQKSLMHVHAIVNGVQVKAMVDNGAVDPAFSTRCVPTLLVRLTFRLFGEKYDF